MLEDRILFLRIFFPPAQLKEEYSKKTIILWSTTYFSEIPDDLRSDKDCPNSGQELCEMITDKNKYMVGGYVFGFWPKTLERWWESSTFTEWQMTYVGMVVILGGPGDTSTLHAKTKLD